MADEESDYQVELFREKGFQRKSCGKCNRYFWTLDPDKATCGEPPCDEYSFIGEPPTKQSLSLHEMRELYLRFFEKNGHSRISRYPIVARWRDDVFFTQASIYCFQPWVIIGAVKPPANPLTISQTCVRFNDIDNVGKTGRHFTMFEMMAHHCFNTKDKFIYFKDRTVDLCNRLLTEELGIDPTAVSYIESKWAGGGNSGPCFEVLVDGIELSTLVFMMYEEKDGKIREMDMQVVDTGYGLERFTWISQGTSSAYEAVFGYALESLKDHAGVSGDEEILAEYSRVAGLMNVESNADLKVLRRKVAERLEITPEKLVAEIVPMENLYTICDHTRALVFMLQDGVLPSNVKEGYFARMLVRRTVRSLNSLKMDTPISDIVDMQIDYFADDFPDLRENWDELVKIVRVEEDKYKRTTDKGRSTVRRMDDRLKREGSGAVGLKDLMELYDSQGITPDLVKEFSSLQVNVPDDFYIQVGKSHERPEAEKEEAKQPVIQIPKDVAATVLGYYEDANVRRFASKVLSVFGNYVILDKTYFYPEGGGQETDLGTLNAMPVSHVHKIGAVVAHEVAGDVSGIKAGDAVNCEVDPERRLQLMQHHTATHIINGAARKLLGNHIWQTGAHKSVKSARLDITHYAALTDEEVCRIEALANHVVSEGREIGVKFMERSAAEKEYGFRLYQGGVVPGGEIRVVNIKDWDVEACGGMHLSNTKDAGPIKITGSKRIQDGVVRLEYVAGEAAQRYFKERQELAGKIAGDAAAAAGLDIDKVAEIFSVPPGDLPKTVKRFREEWHTQREEVQILEKRLEELTHVPCYHSRKYAEIPCGESYTAYKELFDQWKSQRKDLELQRKELGDILADDLEKKFDSGQLVKETVYGMGIKELTELAKKVVRGRDRLLILVNVSRDKSSLVVASSCQYDAGDVAKRLSRELGGGAHGDKRLAIGGGGSKDIRQILERFKP